MKNIRASLGAKSRSLIDPECERIQSMRKHSIVWPYALIKYYISHRNEKRT